MAVPLQEAEVDLMVTDFQEELPPSRAKTTSPIPVPRKEPEELSHALKLSVTETAAFEASARC